MVTQREVPPRQPRGKPGPSDSVRGIVPKLITLARGAVYTHTAVVPAGGTLTIWSSVEYKRVSVEVATEPAAPLSFTQTSACLLVLGGVYLLCGDVVVLCQARCFVCAAMSLCCLPTTTDGEAFESGGKLEAGTVLSAVVGPVARATTVTLSLSNTGMFLKSKVAAFAMEYTPAAGGAAESRFEGK